MSEMLRNNVFSICIVYISFNIESLIYCDIFSEKRLGVFPLFAVTKFKDKLLKSVQRHSSICSLLPSVAPGMKTGSVLPQSDSDDSIWGSKQQHH